MGEKGLNKDALRLLGHSSSVELQGKGFEISGDGKTAFNPETGQNAHQDLDKGQWIDNKTGEALTKPIYEGTTPAK